jgi:hypothetical protein
LKQKYNYQTIFSLKGLSADGNFTMAFAITSANRTRAAAAQTAAAPAAALATTAARCRLS